MSPSADDVTTYVAQVIEKHGLPEIIASYDEAIHNYASSQYNGKRSFGMNAWENRYLRCMDKLANRHDLPFEVVRMGIDRIAIRHLDYGLIVIYMHNVDPPEYTLPRGSAKTVKKHATAKGSPLFGSGVEPVKHRMVGIVGDPHQGLQEVVVGTVEEAQVRPDLYKLTNRITIYSAMDEVAVEPEHLGLNGVPEEPEAKPKLSVDEKKKEEKKRQQNKKKLPSDDTSDKGVAGE